MPNGGGQIDIEKWLKEHDSISDEDFRFLVGHSLAHIRTNLFGLYGYLSMFVEGDFGKIPSQQMHLLKQLVDTKGRTVGVINSLFDLKHRYEQQVTSTPGSNPSSERRPKILHFEDDSFLSGMYGLKFTKAGMDYAIYSNPTLDPVSIVLKERPDLILMNVIMPVMDGFQAATAIKADSRTRVIPLVFLTTLGQKEDISKGMELGASDYIVKADDTPDDVIDRVRARLGFSASKKTR